MEPLYTIKEACRQLRTSPETLYRWMRDGELRYVLVGGQRRIRESDIQAFIKLPDQRQTEPSPEAR